MKKYLLHVLIISSVFLLPNVAKATEAYDFMSAVINSLQSVKIADDRRVLNSNDNDDSAIIMKNIMVYNKELKEASRFIEPYTSSKSEITKSASTTFCGVYSLIILNMESILSLYENVLIVSMLVTH